MIRKFLLLGAYALALISCKSEIENIPTDSIDHTTRRVGRDIIVHELLINGNRTYVNEINGEYRFAEDVIISPKQFDLLKKLANRSLSTSERSTVVKDLVKTWPNGVVYYKLPEKGAMTEGYHKMFIENIQKAFNMISSKTKVKFIQRTSQPEYINFVFSDANSSPLGWYRNRVNKISIYNFAYPGIISHEIMHSLGIMHEQCRPDRDKYIIVHIDQVPPSSRLNYNIYWDYEGVGTFDFNSVMLYGSFDFSPNSSSPIMTKLDGSTFNKQRERISEIDYAGISKLYGGASTNPQPEPQPAPTAPSNLHLLEATETSIDFSWIASTEVKQYEVYRNGQKIGNTAQERFKDTGLQSNTEYKYQVKAIGTNGKESSLSAVFLGKTKEKQGQSSTTWDRNKAYVKGDRVVYNGLNYEAKWWTKGNQPDSSDVWKLLDTNTNSSSEWNKDKAYTAGIIVTYQGKKYKAKWWTRGDVPGQASVWQAL